MSYLSVFFVCAVYLRTLNAQPQLETQQHFEFEQAVPESQTENWRWRSEASGHKTLRINDEMGASRLELTLCVEPYNTTQNVTLSIYNIRYSNDGLSDDLELWMNGTRIANFTTISKFGNGYEWNVIRNSRRLGSAASFPRGSYTLVITVITDSYGVELDRIGVSAVNQNPYINLFCGSKLYFIA